MFGIGFGELVVIFVVALLVIGPDKLPEVAKTLGKALASLRKHQVEFKRTLEQELASPINEINETAHKVANDLQNTVNNTDVVNNADNKQDPPLDTNTNKDKNT